MVWFVATWGCADPTESTTPLVPPVPDGCRLDEQNALRVVCSFGDAPPVDVTLTLTPRGDAPARVSTGTSSRVVGWGLVPETAYDWTVADAGGEVFASGQLDTGPLPEALASLTFAVDAASPEAVGVDLLLMPSSCPVGHLLMVDRLGRIVWYETVEAATGGNAINANAVAWTDHGTILVLAGRSVVSEVTPEGEVLFTAVSGEAFDGPVHHDVFERDGYVYVPQARQQPVDGAVLVVDQVLVLDRSGAVVGAIDTYGLYPFEARAWMLGGYWAFTFVNAVDFTHLNSVYVDAAGDVWVSFRHLHAFAKLRGGPGTAGFGELLWTAVGSDTSPVPSDLTLGGAVDPSFSGQHDVHLGADGTVLLLDNGLPPSGSSRAVRYAIDEVAGTLTALQAWDLGAVCPVQGSVRELPNGDLVVACPATGTVVELTADGVEVWRLSATCDDSVLAPITRAVPLPW